MGMAYGDRFNNGSQAEVADSCPLSPVGFMSGPAEDTDGDGCRDRDEDAALIGRNKCVRHTGSGTGDAELDQSRCSFEPYQYQLVGISKRGYPC